MCPAGESPPAEGHLLAVTSRDRREKTLVSLPLLIMAPALLNEGPALMTSLTLCQPLTGPVSNTVTPGLKVSTYGFGGDTNSL